MDGRALVALARAMAANTRSGLDDALKNLASTPHDTENRAVQRTPEAYIFRLCSAIAEMVGPCWAALTLNKYPARRG